MAEENDYSQIQESFQAGRREKYSQDLKYGDHHECESEDSARLLVILVFLLGWNYDHVQNEAQQSEHRYIYDSYKFLIHFTLGLSTTNDCKYIIFYLFYLCLRKFF